jgi:hypothetical protein
MGGVPLSTVDGNVRAALVAGGASANIDKIASEWSISFAPGDVRLANAVTVAQFIARGSVWLASLGWKQSIPYAHGSVLLGPVPSTEAAYNVLDKVSDIAGKTMTSIQLQADASWLVTANGVTVTI